MKHLLNIKAKIKYYINLIKSFMFDIESVMKLGK